MMINEIEAAIRRIEEEIKINEENIGKLSLVVKSLREEIKPEGDKLMINSMGITNHQPAIPATREKEERMMQTKLTSGMIMFLDKRNGNELIKTAYEFRMTYGLSHEEACYLIELWKDIPIV